MKKKIESDWFCITGDDSEIEYTAEVIEKMWMKPFWWFDTCSYFHIFDVVVFVNYNEKLSSFRFLLANNFCEDMMIDVWAIL